MRLEGRVALVTGASGGLGRAIVDRLEHEGARVFAAYHAHPIERADAIALDVRDRASADRAIAHVVQRAGRLDVVVNNAGVNRDALFGVTTGEDWREVLAVNLDGVFHVTRAAVRAMLGAGGGAIVNVASTAALKASPGQSAYAASKGGVLALTRTLAAELAPRGIRVNAVVPGFIEAGMAERMDPRAAAARRREIPLARFGTAPEVASLVAFLASDDASYVIGQAIAADGGLSV